MMNKWIYVALMGVMAWMGFSSIEAKSNVQKVYVFGFAASFNDSTVYFTDIQEIDSAWVDTKTDFLLAREQYSYQLREYLANHFEPNRTCITTFALDRKKIEKKYVKMKNRYTKEKYTKKHGQFDVKYITTHDFAYKSVAPVNYNDEENNLSKQELKAKRKAEKEARKQARKAKGKPKAKGGDGPEGR